MKRLICGVMLSALVAASCSVFETSDNGDLDGMWQLQAVDTLSTGGTADMRNAGCFWMFQMTLLEMRDGTMQKKWILYHFEHKGDSILLSSPYIDNRAESDVAVEDVELLQPYGINGFNENLYVEQLSRSKLVLRTPLLRLYLRKY